MAYKISTSNSITSNYRFKSLAGSSRLVGFGKVSIENITRTGLSEEVLKALAARRPPVDDSGEADFRFGAPSRFSLIEPEKPTNPNVSIIVGGGGSEEEEEVPPEAQVLVYNEVYKETEEVRVENPDDPEDYVIIRRRIYSIFLGQDGIYRQFVYDNSNLGG